MGPSDGVANIGPRERRRRWLTGAAGFAVAALVAALFVVAGVPRWWRALVFVPAWVGALGVFQARAKT